jgi:hypothetical protein
MGLIKGYTSFVKKVLSEKDAEIVSKLRTSLLKIEARVGAKIFGGTDGVYRREFYCLDNHTWVFKQADQEGNKLTTYFDVRPSGVFKLKGGSYCKLESVELHRFVEAVKIYQQKVMQEIYFRIV